uniref:Uncharacterized protein n=1 Tax=Anguilla anguilla TaxID=7936 RepID=A0A0E9TTP9_ANGAN
MGISRQFTEWLYMTVR